MSDSRIYRDGDKLIKVYQSASYEYVEQAYLRQKFAYDSGVPVPAVFGIKKINKTETALEMEYLNGKPLTHMYEGKGDEMMNKAVMIMIKLQCRMYAVDAGGLPNLTNMYIDEITSTPYLAPQLKETLLDYMKKLDKNKTNLCHGDIHPYNIMYNDDKYWIIDWEDAGKGDPAADACMQYFYSIRWGAKNNNRTYEQYLQLFCEESRIPQEDILAWLPVIAGVQVNINDDSDRMFISRFIDEWYKNYIG